MSLILNSSDLPHKRKEPGSENHYFFAYTITNMRDFPQGGTWVRLEDTQLLATIAVW
jgi:hypothetical protein